jgi:hypothetical protein
MKIIWVRHVVCIGEMRNAYKIFIGKPEDTNNLGDLGVHCRIVLKRMLMK